MSDAEDESPSVLRSAIVGFGGLVAGILGTLGTQVLIDEYFPPTKGATIGEICLETSIRRQDYLQRTGAKAQAERETASTRNRIGLVATADVEITGYKRWGSEPVIVRGVVLNARTGARVPGSEPLVQGRSVEASASTIRRAPSVWLPMPGRAGRYVFRVQVNEPVGAGSETIQRLAQRDGPQFDVRSDSRVRLGRSCRGV